jgi:rhamnose utilization protein RhaD (predicted bifunctional aldolase and dehydrogenase)/NAD(P)-dependent dehydrogenase (short-subunit alcohol dehydrogenase family)
MRSRWSDREAARFVARYGAEWGEPLALRTYSARLLGAEPTLVLHGGGNSSVKALWTNAFGEEMEAVFVKASGVDMANIEPAGHVGLDLEYLLRLRMLPDLDDSAMVEQLRTHLLRADSPNPSIEALVHAFLPGVFIDHTHADAVLTLTNRAGGEAVTREALGDEVAVLPYVTPGFKLALAASMARTVHPRVRGLVWSHHGVVTWGDTAGESYEMMIDLVSHAESFVAKSRATYAVKGAPSAGPAPPAPAKATEAGDQAVAAAESDRRLAQVTPILRGLLAERTGDCDRPYRRVVLQVSSGPEILAALAMPEAREALATPPLTTDHLIRTKALPLWLDGLDGEDESELSARLAAAVQEYSEFYKAYLERHSAAMPAGVEPFAPSPRVVMIAGLGAFCAGVDLREAAIARDITEHTIAAKTAIAAAGSTYRGLPEDEVFNMEYRSLQHAKLGMGEAAPLRGHVALVTGAAGAIGTGICQGLLDAGCLVAATDLPGDPLKTLAASLGKEFPGKILGVTLDVTDPASVAAAFAQVARTWGGVDLVVPNAGVAAVASLTDLSLDEYRRLERVNVEGTLLVLAEAARLFKRQATGGDVVLISTKNVFAPGASFGAYSSTKAAAHQLARVASLELAADDVRVNMVAPDAVFASGSCRSGLWAEVGPERMKARGLDEAGLEAYYQNRNLLKARVTAAHVANAVLFFATRQTPTTGATIPVDGGLPDSTPR